MFPRGDHWTLWAHDPGSEDWSAASYKLIGELRDWGALWGTLREIGRDRLLANMWFLMHGTTPPLWENFVNIRGGSYCIKTSASEEAIEELVHVYFAAAITGTLAVDSTNVIKGVTLSPKARHCIIKVWNTTAIKFFRPTDIRVLVDGMRPDAIVYKPHVDQRM